jgi:hypothetical protein
VKLDRARDVSLAVEIGVLVDLRHDHLLVVEMLGEPVGRDENLLRVAVLRHAVQPTTRPGCE